MTQTNQRRSASEATLDCYMKIPATRRACFLLPRKTEARPREGHEMDETSTCRSAQVCTWLCGVESMEHELGRLRPWNSLLTLIALGLVYRRSNLSQTSIPESEHFVFNTGTGTAGSQRAAFLLTHTQTHTRHKAPHFLPHAARPAHLVWPNSPPTSVLERIGSSP